MQFVDSDVLVEIQKGSPEAGSWLREIKGSICLPAAVSWEFLIGSRNKEELDRSRRFLATYQVVHLDVRDSEKVGELIAKYGLRSGASLSDFLIAAQALCRNATLFSFNQRHYRQISGLDSRPPYERQMELESPAES